MTPAAMDPMVFAAVLAAAAMHAGWNAVLKLKIEPLLAMTLIAAMSGLVALAALPFVGLPRTEAWPWLAGSVALHLASYGALTEAYRRADMGQIYPVARGGAPLLTALASLLILHEPISARAGLGIALLGGGVTLMSLRGSRRAAPDRVAIAFALLTATLICGYTLVDGIGARAAGDPHAYSAALFVIDGVPLLVIAWWRAGWAGLRPLRRHLGPGLAGGAMSLGSYWIAIWAMTVAPIALVAALRESSVLFGALIAVLILKEPLVPVRVAAAALILGGLALIRLQ